MDTNKMRDLKALAETCLPHQPLRFMRSHGALYIRNDSGIVFDVHQNRSFPGLMAQNKDYADFALACTPATVLALLAENDRVKARLCMCRDCGGQGELYSGHSSYQGYNQPPEPDMDVCGTCGGDGVLGQVEDFEALAAERDQLKAENEALRKDAERYRFLRNQHWPVAELAVVCNPKVSVKLGHDCPSEERLDEQVDGAMKRAASHD